MSIIFRHSIHAFTQNFQSFYLSRLALKLHEEFLQQAHDKPRELAMKLNTLVEQMQTSCVEHDRDNNNTAALAAFTQSLADLKSVLMEKNKSISSYELSISGLVPAMLRALCPKQRPSLASMKRTEAFASVFDLTNQLNRDG